MLYQIIVVDVSDHILNVTYYIHFIYLPKIIFYIAKNIF